MGEEFVTSFELGDGVSLRAHRVTDAEAVFEVVDRNRANLLEFMHWMTPEYSIESAREFIKHAIASRVARENIGYGIFKEERFIGAIGFVKFDWQSKKTEIGYWIDAAEQGNGIVTRACVRLIGHAFEELGMHRIEIRCSTRNTRSAAIPKRLGFQLEGVLREAAFRNGTFHDYYYFGLLAREWDKGRLNS